MTASHPKTQAAPTTTTLAAPPRPGPTPAQIQARQRADAERDRDAAASRAVAAPNSTAVALLDSRTSVQQYIDGIAPAKIVGRMIKFAGKEGRFVTADDGAPISDETDFAALCDQCLIGWLKFNGPGEPPDRHMGLLYDGFIMPSRETLGDADYTKWELGLDGQPADPWQHHIYMVLQNVETQELFTYVTSNQTGRRAIGNLLRHYDRVRKTDSNFYPLVRLRAAGFQHKDERIGWVPTPLLVSVGRVPRTDTALPDASPASGMNDEIPF
jgi:hypothetical protein